MTTPDAVHDSTNCPRIDSVWFDSNTVLIAKFEKVFVLSYSKRVMDRRTPLPWIAHPTSLDSRGYHATFDAFPGETAAALYGTFLNLVKLSTLSPPYGALAHSDGEPFKLPYIENRTRIPRALIIQAVEWFLKIGWLEAVPLPSCSRHDAVMPPSCQRHDYVTLRDDTERNGKEKRAKGRSPPALVTESPPFDDIEQHWNHSLAVSHTLTDSRRSKLQARWKDAEFRTRWREAIDRIGSSDFCRGLNDRGWKCSLDWFLKPDTFTKVLEGNYDNHKNPARPARGNSAAVREDTNGNAFAAVYGPDIFAEDPAGVDATLFDEENAGTDSASTRHLGQGVELSFP